MKPPNDADGLWMYDLDFIKIDEQYLYTFVNVKTYSEAKHFDASGEIGYWKAGIIKYYLYQ